MFSTSSTHAFGIDVPLPLAFIWCTYAQSIPIPGCSPAQSLEVVEFPNHHSADESSLVFLELLYLVCNIVHLKDDRFMGPPSNLIHGPTKVAEEISLPTKASELITSVV